MRQIKLLGMTAVAIAGLLTTANAAKAELVYGLSTTNTLFTFDSATPGTILSGSPIMGLSVNESLVGIDFRPATGQLYAVSNFNRIYTVGTSGGSTGQLTSVATLSTPLNGTSFDIDFNPTVDRIRIVSDARQNLRVDPTTGAATVDGNINYAIGTANPNLSGAAYTNNFAGAGTTTLYTIDATANSLNTQGQSTPTVVSPNTGTQFVVGSLGIDATNVLGFDISGATGNAYVVAQDGSNGFSQFYTVNLATGAAGTGGLIGGGFFVADLSVATVPEPASLGLAGLAVAGLVARRRRA